MANINLTEWKIRGFVGDISAIDFNIGDLTINLGNIKPVNCTKGLVNGSHVVD